MDTRDCNLSAKPLLQPPESLFERCSWFYALCREYLFRDHTPEIARSLFPSGDPSPGTHVVEVGCGPGFYSCRLAQEFPQLQTTGVDLSEPLLRRAKRRARRRCLPNCTFCRGDAHALPGALGPVDALVVSRLFLIVQNRRSRRPRDLPRPPSRRPMFYRRADLGLSHPHPPQLHVAPLRGSPLRRPAATGNRIRPT